MNAQTTITAPPPPMVGPHVDAISQASAFTHNATVALGAIEKFSFDLARAESTTHPERFRSLGGQIESLANLANDQLNRASNLMIDAIEGVPTVSPVQTAFAAWRDAAIHYLSTNVDDDEEFDRRGDREHQALQALQALADAPAATTDDVALKFLAVAYWTHSAPPLNGKRGRHPLVMEAPDGDLAADVIWRGVLWDLPRVSRPVREAMGMTGTHA